MARFWAIAALALFAMVGALTHAGEEKDFAAKGTLTKDDPKDQQRGGPTQVHAVKLKAGKVYTIDMVGAGFDSYLRLLDAKGNQLEEDDDSGGNLNARILFNCTKDGEYKVVCTTFGAAETGAYTLTVKTTGGIPKPSTSHAQMIGKSAPDFQGDFAVNGKPARLADLKGKTVLLAFLDVRSGASTALLPKLADWHKTYKGEGLTIVGVSFYPTDIGQKLGFDEEAGKVITVAKSDRKSDQALLGAYARHHKIEHLLMTMPRQYALATFNDYVVNGFPQVVLIDRLGVVRLIDIGGDKGAATVETELKKLLTEK